MLQLLRLGNRLGQIGFGVFKLYTRFPHESLMGLSREINSAGWLVRDDFSEMIVNDLGLPTG